MLQLPMTVSNGHEPQQYMNLQISANINASSFIIVGNVACGWEVQIEVWRKDTRLLTVS